MDNLFVVEHFINDKEVWGRFKGNWKKILSDEDMTVDKGLQLPKWEGNHCLLKINDVTGTMVIGLWKLPSGATTSDFQAFMDRFTGPSSTNTVSAVEETLGAEKLGTREFMRDFIHAAQGKTRVGYADKPMFWMTRHEITDKKAWENDVMDAMAAATRKNCTTPSDAIQLFPKGHGTSLVLFLSNNVSLCFDGTGAGMTEEEYQKVVDEFTKGAAKNTPFILNPDKCIGINNLSEDVWNQSFFKWSHEYVNPYAKTASHEANPVAASGHHIASQ